MNPQTLSSQPGRFRHLAIALGLALAVLAGCGGGSASSSNDNSKTGSNGADAASATASAAAANNPSAAAPSSALLAKAAALNKAELERAAQAEPVASQGATGGQSKQKAAAAASSVSKFSGGTRVPVVRFYSPTESAHFYTANATPLLLALQAHPGLRTLHRPANLEDLFLKLTGRQIREDG